MIYGLGKIVLVPGKMAEWAEISKESPSVYTKLGMKWVASWHGYTGNMNEIYNLFAYNDLAEFQKIMTARRQNPENQKLSAKQSPLIVSQVVTLIEPNPWSPMK
jgi:hypothetical protein